MPGLDKQATLEANSESMDTDDQNSIPDTRADIASRYEQSRNSELDTPLEVELDTTGVDSVERMHETGEEEGADDLQIDLDAEPKTPQAKKLEDFIEYDGEGNPVMKMIIDGVEELVPLEEARVMQQKSRASDRRFNEVSRWADDLTKRERLLAEEKERLASQIADPLPEGVDDQDVDEEYLDDIRGVVDEILHGDEDDAAEALARVLARKPKNLSDNSEALVDAAVKKVRDLEAKDDEEAAMREGFNKFKKTYANNIMKDDDLYAFANLKSTQLAEANPDWTPTEVMLEAGRLTLDKFNIEADEEIEQEEVQNTNDRQSQKDNLVPIPPKRSGTIEPEPAERQDTPEDVMAEIRQSRGQ